MLRPGIGKLTKTVVDIFFYAGIICVAGIPLWGKIVNMQYNYDKDSWAFMIAVLFLSGVLAVYILYNFKCMFKTLIAGNPFVWDNIRHFDRMAVSCTVIALIYIVKSFVIFSIATVVIVCVFIIAALFCLTLKDIFKQAIIYKEENDWTV